MLFYVGFLYICEVDGTFFMLEQLQDKFVRLVALYEQKNEECTKLQEKLREFEKTILSDKKLIVELQEQIDNLKLAGAFGISSFSSSEAKSRIEGLIAGIDRCISLLEK